MNPIEIKAFVSKAAALAAGRTLHGYETVALSDANVSSLSQAARDLIATGDPSVSVDSTDVSTVLAAVEAKAAEQLAAQAKAKADLDHRIVAACAAPDSAWIDHASPLYDRELGVYEPVGRPQVASSPLDGGATLPNSADRDERVQARRSRVDLSADLLAYEERVQEWRAKIKAQREAEKARQDAWLAATREYVIANVPDFARAAREGCDVGVVAKAALGADLVAHLEQSELSVVPTYADVEPHGRPRQFAYVRYDAVRDACAIWQSELPAGLVTSVAYGIVRGDTCPENGCSSGHRSLVAITVEFADGGTRDVCVYADSSPRHVHSTSVDDADDADDE